MSRRNKHNRFAGNPDFQEVRQTNTDDKVASSASPKIEPVIANTDDDEESSSYFDFGKIGAFFGECCGNIATYSKSAACNTWEWCQSSAQWVWGGLKAIPSYCVIRWDSEDEAESPESSTKPEPAKINTKSENKTNVASADEYEEDDLAPSRWWSVGVKTAAASVAALVLVGGYFAVKPLLDTPPATSDIETVEITEQIVPEVSPPAVPDTTFPVATVTAPSMFFA